MLRLAQAALDELRLHGEETYPRECCGILLGRADPEHNEREVTRAIRCANTRTDSPQNRYNIDPRELIAAQKLARERGEDIVGFYHSHPDHPAQWSQTDLNEAHWIGCSYVIVAVEKGRSADIKSFLLAGTLEEDKHFEPEELKIVSSSKFVSKA